MDKDSLNNWIDYYYGGGELFLILNLDTIWAAITAEVAITAAVFLNALPMAKEWEGCGAGD